MSGTDVDYTIDSSVEEPLTLSRRRRREDAEMDITPMIDITFLLLIFFLVAARLTDEGFVELPTAKHGTSVSNETSVVVTLAKSPTGEDAVIYKGDGANDATRILAPNPADQQSELTDFIQEQLTVGSKTQVLIKAQVGVRHRDVARVAKAAGDATAHVMYVAVLEER